jgi:hypothetical protein
LISRDIPRDVRLFLDWWFRPHEYPHTEHDGRLKEHGLYSVDAFLSAWTRHVALSERLVAGGRGLLIRTHELSRSHDRLAAFLGMPITALDGTHGHRNRRTWTGALDNLVPRASVEGAVQRVCGDFLEKHFPEV